MVRFCSFFYLILNEIAMCGFIKTKFQVVVLICKISSVVAGDLATNKKIRLGSF